MALAKNLTPEEVKELSKWKKIEDADTEITLKRYIGDREVVTKRELMMLWGKVDRKTIERYVAKGMPIHTSSFKGFQVFDLKLCEEWRDENINKSQSSKANKSKSTEIVVDTGSESEDEEEDTTSDIKSKIDAANELLNIKSTTIETAERIDKTLKALHSAVKLDELYKDLVPSKDVQKVIVEIVSGVVTGYKRNTRILPKECANRNESEIREILNREYEATIKRLEKIAKSEFLEEAAIYDVIEEIYNLLSNGVSPKILIDKLKELPNV